MKYETGGDPITGLKWTRRTTSKVAKELKSIGIEISKNTVGRLLKEMDYSLRVNHKKIESGVRIKPEDRGNRNKQFEYISNLRDRFVRNDNPIISVDSKKKELIGNFKNPGNSWNQKPIPVNDHDFLIDALGKGIPYGIYDTQTNIGSVFVGMAHETPSFAVESIEKWWRREGFKQYPEAKKILILADCGGGNSARSRVWKCEIQKKLCDRHNLSVSVSHYPPGASKWNPIEHRLFSEISKNWSGKPLDSYETMLKYIQTTKTSSGLKVNAYLVQKKYKTGQRVSDDQMYALSLRDYAVLPKWNYTLSPRKM